MYGKGKGKLTPKFLDYVNQRKYVLRNLSEFCEVIFFIKKIWIFFLNFSFHFLFIENITKYIIINACHTIQGNNI